MRLLPAKGGGAGRIAIRCAGSVPAPDPGNLNGDSMVTKKAATKGNGRAVDAAAWERTAKRWRARAERLKGMEQQHSEARERWVKSMVEAAQAVEGYKAAEEQARAEWKRSHELVAQHEQTIDKLADELKATQRERDAAWKEAGEHLEAVRELRERTEALESARAGTLELLGSLPRDGVACVLVAEFSREGIRRVRRGLVVSGLLASVEVSEWRGGAGTGSSIARAWLDKSPTAGELDFYASQAANGPTELLEHHRTEANNWTDRYGRRVAGLMPVSRAEAYARADRADRDEAPDEADEETPW